MDRRTVWVILLMMMIAVAPALFIERPEQTAESPAGAAGDSTADTVSGRLSQPPPTVAAPVPDTAPAGAAAPTEGADTIRVSSPLYTYGISTVGGKLVESRLERYRSMAEGDSGRAAQILPRGSELLGLTLVVGSDSVSLDRWQFTPSTDVLRVTREPASLRLTGSSGGIGVELT
jgi:YidC/Oxa1 family membrane protein insertase